MINKKTTTRVGIITFHNTSNFGAALQAYALERVLNEVGVEAEVIDYSNSYRRSKYDPWDRLVNAAKTKNPISFIKFCLGYSIISFRNKKFADFYSKFCNYSSVKIEDKDALAAHAEAYDILVAGSDQIWSHKNNGNDDAYLLNFPLKETKKVSYASSFGLGDIEPEYRETYKTALSDFEALAVREASGANIINKLMGVTPAVVFDPTLLIEKDEWRKLFGHDSSTPKDGVVSYVNSTKFHRKIMKCISSQVEQGKLAVFGSFNLPDVVNRNVNLRLNSSPTEFLAGIECSKYIITTSYHAVIFSIIFEKNFWAILSGDIGRDSRIKNLLEHFQLEDRMLALDELDNLQLESDIDYSHTRDLLQAGRQNSLQYINQMVDQ